MISERTNAEIVAKVERDMREAEIRRKYDRAQPCPKPANCTWWVWLHHNYEEDVPLWQSCLVATYGADAKDPTGAAQKMYARLKAKQNAQKVLP